MKKTAFLSATLFAASVIALSFSGPASAEGDCAFGHSLKTAQSSAQQVAQTKPLQTPKPSGS
ncbi:MAG: hypothetical protein HQ483_08520 [Rhodospirillales bacterium]|nr:hypothetical protein [Rhodospirillales bacterium]